MTTIPVSPTLNTNSNPSPSTLRRRLEGLVSGGFAGAFSKTCTAPFDRIKILCQTGASPRPLVATRQVWREEGWRGFFRGNLVSVMRIIPNKGVLFMCSDFYKDLFRSRNQPNAPLTGFQYVSAGSLSGATTVLATYPLDLIRGRLSGAVGTTSRYHGIIQTFQLTLKEEGFRSLYRGMGPSLVGAFPYEGIRFGVYDYLKHHYVPEGAPVYYNGFVGATSALAAATVLFPNDTVRRRMQMQVRQRAPKVVAPSASSSAATSTTSAAATTAATTASGDPIYKHGLDCYTQLYRRYGISIFYRGLTANLLRVVPSAALQFASFEWGKRLLRDRSNSSN